MLLQGCSLVPHALYVPKETTEENYRLYRCKTYGRNLGPNKIIQGVSDNFCMNPARKYKTL